MSGVVRGLPAHPQNYSHEFYRNRDVCAPGDVNLVANLNLISTVGSTMCRLYFHPSTNKVIDDAPLSMASTVAAIVLCTAAVPLAVPLPRVEVRSAYRPGLARRLQSLRRCC
jgi:hypothetical protein